MMEGMKFGDRLRHAFDVLRNKDPSSYYNIEGASYSVRPDRPIMHYGKSQSILAPIYTRLAIDVSQLDFREVLTDQNGRYKDTIKSGLTECLTIAANLDQGSRAFIRECCMNLFEDGVIAIMPTKTDIDPLENGGYKIEELRVGEILEWFPEDVRVRIYNDKTGLKEEIVYPKRLLAIVENPFYAVMNESNTVIRSVMSNFNYLEKVNSQTTSGKMNLIVQLPYPTNSERKREIAKAHIKEIETQMSTSDHGIAYIDATEKVIQLNRSVENNFVTQIEFMLKTLYSQLGLTEAVMNGTASEEEMLNYYNRAIEPIASAIAEEMNRKFLTKTGRTQGHKIMFFRDPFKLVPANQLSEIMDKLTRNEIFSTNDSRAVMGYKPIDDPRADELRNKNLNIQEGYEPITTKDEE